jgi:hypothetical protein
MDRIDALRYLIDVAETGSFSAVARQRSVATSTVALAITQLEQEFDARLMIRSTRRLALTHEGQICLRRRAEASETGHRNGWPTRGRAAGGTDPRHRDQRLRPQPRPPLSGRLPRPSSGRLDHASPERQRG